MSKRRTGGWKAGVLAAAWWLAAGLLAVGLQAEGLPGDEPSAVANERGKIVQRDYVFEQANNRRTQYALLIPSGYDKAKPAPLVVLLHGLYSNPWQVIHYQGIAEQAEKRGYFVVAPYGYNEGGWYGSRGPGKDNGLGIAPPPNSPNNLGELSEEDVLNVLKLVRQDYPIDPKRIYLMGHSMGGGGTLYLGMKYKELWAALAPMAPAIYSKPEGLEAIRGTPIIVVQGDHDVLVKAENTRRWVAEMKTLGMDYQYIEIKGGDHLFSIVANPGMIAKVFDFFDAHRK